MTEAILDRVISLLWRYQRWLLPLTHYQKTRGMWTPRRWSRLLRVYNWPWLWCGCGDGLGTWDEVKRRRCETCQMVRDLSWGGEKQ